MFPDDFIPYSRWSERQPGTSPSSHPIGATEGVTLHWEGPHMGAFSHDKCAGKVRSIQTYHLNHPTQDWADIAYNAVVCPHGAVFEARGIHTKSGANGSDAANDSHYAVCYLGGEGDGFTEAGKKGFHEAVQWLRTEGDAGAEVNGHRDHKATTCPGNEIYEWLDSHNFNVSEEDIMASKAELRALLKEQLAPLKKDHDELAAAVAKLHERVHKGFLAERDRDRKERDAATDADA